MPFILLQEEIKLTHEMGRSRKRMRQKWLMITKDSKEKTVGRSKRIKLKQWSS